MSADISFPHSWSSVCGGGAGRIGPVKRTGLLTPTHHFLCLSIIFLKGIIFITNFLKI